MPSGTRAAACEGSRRWESTPPRKAWRTPIHRAVELVRVEAARYGVPIKECELVGLVPLEAMADVFGYYLQVPGVASEKVIEYHLLPGDDEAAA